MKFTFIFIVILISCSVCTCNDLGIFSDINFDLDRPKSDSRVRDYDRFYQKPRYAYRSAVLPEDYEEQEPKLIDTPDYESIPDKIRQFQEVIDWERSHLHKHRPHHENPNLRYYLDKLSKPERFHLDIPRLEEPRVFAPAEEVGFRLGNEKNDDLRRLFDDAPFETYGNTERFPPVNFQPEEHHSHHQVHPNDENTIQFASNRYNDVKVAEDPSEFAYLPSDPRFYRKIEESTERTPETTTITTARKAVPTKPKQQVPPPDTFLVDPRSDQQLVGGSHRFFQEDSRHKDGSIEVVPLEPNLTDVDSAGVYIIAIVAGISAAATVGLIAVGIGWYNLQKHVKNASDVDYPAYGVTGPNKDVSPSGDRRLAQSAQMYHYQHQKQQIIAMERAPPGERNGSVSEAESDEENEEGDYTVYECPGLAPTGEMEVKNPLFQDDPTPAQTPATKATTDEKK